MPRGVRLNPQHDDKTRAKIQTSQIVNRLTSFINGQVEMSAPQVTAALGLLKKTLPDLSQSDVNHTTKREPSDYSRAELLAIMECANAEDGGAGVEPPTGDSGQSDIVH